MTLTGRTRVGHQKGLALLVLLALLGITAVVLIIRISASAADTSDQDRTTARALGLAREALIARAANDVNSPGSLPCPDWSGSAPNIANDGVADLFAGSGCPSYVGRLPWKTLGLPDLRDGYGERLWYALSPSFRDNATLAPINSDTPGQLTVTGITPTNNVVAIVFSAGPAIDTEQRDTASENDPANYLEGSNATPSPQASPNLNYVALQPSGTFNDRLLAITPDMLFPEVERRVAREARYCLKQFGDAYFAVHSVYRYPWAATVNPLTYADSTGTYSGRIPQTIADTDSVLASGGWPMSAHAGVTCFDPTTWWNSWRDLIFYEVARAYAPTPTGTCPADCLIVNGQDSVKVVVIVAGHAFTGSPDQSSRTVIKTIASNYLEANPSSGVNNSLMNGVYAKAPVALAPAAHFNDRLECLQETGTWPC